MKPNEAAEGENIALAEELVRELECMAHLWSGLRPPPPLGKGDISLMGNIRRLQEDIGPVTVSRLAKTMKQSMPGISQKVSVLEKHGYVRRIPEKDDRRVVGLELTEEGDAALAAAMRQLLGRLQHAMERMGEEKSGQLLALLRDLHETIQRMTEEENA